MKVAPIFASYNTILWSVDRLRRDRCYVGVVVSSALAVAIFILDTLSALQFAVAVLYAVVMVCAATFFDRRGVIITAVGCSTLTIVSFMIDHGVHAEETALLRAMVSLSAICITMFLALSSLAANERLRASERKRENLSRYFSPQVIDQLVDIDVPLSVARYHSAVIMFVDVVGFTAYSSQRTPENVMKTLQELLALMSKAVFDHTGTIDKFLGDGLLAVFGYPGPGPYRATSAAQCALDILQSVSHWNAERHGLGEDPLQVAIGLHSGDVVLGNVGCEARLEFTVLGDTVNIASRVEAYCRTLNAEILVTADFIDSLRGEGSSEIAEHFVDQGWHVLRGRTKPIRLYGLRNQAERVPVSKKDGPARPHEERCAK